MAVVVTEMLLLAGKCATADEGRAMLGTAIDSGAAMLKFREWIRAQGGDENVADDSQLMPQAGLVVDVPAPRGCYVAAIDARLVGLAAVALGAGRQKKRDAIDHAVGVVLRKRVGDHTEAGETLLTIRANHRQRLIDAEARLLSAYRWSETQVEPPPLIRRIIR